MLLLALAVAPPATELPGAMLLPEQPASIATVMIAAAPVRREDGKLDNTFVISLYE
ncbi:MAG TPA: hypothetical protein VGK84_04190 [Candidatus Tumulicola sp.]